MLYPTINQYIDALSDARNTSRSLGGVDFCTTITGDPIFDSGNFGVVFKLHRGAETFALKCFTRHQTDRRQAYEKLCCQLPASPYLIDLQWLSEELMIAPYGTDLLMPYDVVRMEFVEGVTLAQALVDAVNKGDRRAIGRLSESFDRMALWLLGEQFAHGDIKPENIMVDRDGELKLVDYDGFYLPSMQGERQREIGTDTFQHPLRQSMIFSQAIDHYPLALLCLSLRALAADPLLYSKKNMNSHELLIRPIDAVAGNSSVLDLIEIEKLVDPNLIACVRSERPELPNLASIISGGESQKKEFNPLYPICGVAGWGFATIDGEVVVSQVYDAVRDFEHNLAAVRMNGKWGFIDPKGNIVVALRYDRVWDFTDEGLALVRIDKKYGFVNQCGRQAIKAKFDYAVSFSQGVAVASVGGKYGYVDTKGKWVIEPQYDYARSFHDAVAEVERDGRSQMITLPTR